MSGNLKTLYIRELVNVGAHDERVDFVMAKREHVLPHFETMMDRDEQAALYHKALKDLTYLIQPVGGAEGVHIGPMLRLTARALMGLPFTPELSDLVLCVEVLATRFEEVLDREDLKL